MSQIQNALQALRAALSRRSRREDEQDLRSLESAASRYFDCFNLGSPDVKAANAVNSICGSMKTEALRRNCSLFAFFIAGVLEKIGKCMSQADPANYTQKRAEDYKDAEGWMNTLTFSRGPPEEFTFPGGSPLGKAFAKMNWSLIGTVDNQHIAAGNHLKRSIRERKGAGSRLRNLWRRIRRRPYPMTETMKPDAEAILTQGFELFVSLPPHPDPVAVRLLVTMLLDGLSCPADGTFRRSERVVVGGKAKTVKAAQMIEAAIFTVVEVLFDASDCAAPGRSELQARPACKLLAAYDEYMQGGGPMEVESKAEERVQEAKGLEPEAAEQAPAEEGAEPAGEGEPALGLEAREPATTQSSDIPSTLPPQEFYAESTSLPSGAEGLPEAFVDLPAEQDLEMADGKRERIRVYAQNAAASAVAAARLSLKSGSATFRIVSLCLRSQFFVRYASQIVLHFLGKELVSKQGLFLLLGGKRRGERYLGFYVKALVELSSGNSNLANLSAAATGIAADEERRVVSGEQQASASFLQGWLKPSAVSRVFHEAGIGASRQTAVALASSINVAADVVLAVLLVALSTAFPPAMIVLAVILAILLIIRSAVVCYTVAVPETLMEKIERKGKGVFEKVAQAVG
ncbi:hypothetical protein, conserved [Eimeria praecox]|uniref:Uncharacterized protein n=1 Tax=Eimeria praecox TaxID=51316 RepID=U6G7J6_9EIME|nr:hypothetical protein, conserved [Eimeria praecox]